MKMRKSDNKGFTLVELIVVLVILAILAAILVPALLGYIDEAKRKQDLLNAKNCLTAMQAQLVECYAKRKPTDECAISGYTEFNGKKSEDVDLRKSDIQFKKKVLETADEKPYIFVAGLGKYSVYKETDIHKAYTVFFAMYMATDKSIPIYFNGKEWSNIYPWNEINPETGKKFADGENKCYYNGELIDMQLYIISAPGDKGYNFWQNLRDKKVY